VLSYVILYTQSTLQHQGIKFNTLSHKFIPKGLETFRIQKPMNVIPARKINVMINFLREFW